MVRFFLTCILLFAALTACRENLPPDTFLTENVKDIVKSQGGRNRVLDSTVLRSKLMAFRSFKVDTSRVMAFYRMRGFRYAWFNEKGLNEQAVNMVGMLSAAQEDGIRLQQSDPGALLDRLGSSAFTSGNCDELELELTARYFEYAGVAYVGLNETKRRELEWYIPSGARNLEGHLNDVLKEGHSFSENQPVYPLYNVLKGWLRYYSNELIKADWKPIRPTRLPLCMGDTSDALIMIRERLVLLKDLPSDTRSNELDSSLSAGVRRFQQRHGLVVSGCIDTHVLDELNRTPAQRVRQLLINMERCRWLPALPDSRFIVVNIPAFRLLVYERDSVIWRDDVIVGKEGWNTTVFTGRLSAIVFNPYWVVPNTILAEEQLDKIRTIPDYLHRNHFEVVTKSRPQVVVDSGKIDWWKMDPLNFPFELRQLPGPWNALGGFKFVFPNNYSIYLHDTPAKQLFNRTDRLMSHGCIRLAHARKLAELLLDNMDQKEFTKIMYTGFNKEVRLNPSIPVFIVYFTAWVDGRGVLNFRKDIYGHDKRLENEIFDE